MIRTIILEADPMVNQMLTDIVHKMKGFQVVASVECLEQIPFCEADLIIGETAKSSESFYDWMRLKRMENPAIDFIAVTGERRYREYRKCVEIGAVDYIIKPFEKARIQAALQRYRQWKSHIMPDEDLQQKQLDAFYFAGDLQKDHGVSPLTYDRVEAYIRSGKTGWFTAKEAALEMKISPVTMRRYLESMYKNGLLRIQSQYGKKGRPVYQYHVVYKEEMQNGYNDRCDTE